MHTTISASQPSVRRKLRLLGLDGRTALLVLALAVVAVLFLWPLFEIARLSFSPGFTFTNYSDIFGTAAFRTVVVDTFEIALMVTAVTLVIAVPLAYYIWNRTGTAKIICLGLLIVPLGTGILVKNLVWTVLLEGQGVVYDVLHAIGLTSQPINILFTRTAVVIGMVHYLLPIAVVPIYSSLTRVDRRLLLAARSLGASRTETLRLVTLPMISPGLVSGTAVIFILSLGFYVTPAMLGGRGDQMIANLVDTNITELANFPAASALSLLVVLTVVVFLPLVFKHMGTGQVAGTDALFQPTAASHPGEKA